MAGALQYRGPRNPTWRRLSHSQRERPPPRSRKRCEREAEPAGDRGEGSAASGWARVAPCIEHLLSGAPAPRRAQEGEEKKHDAQHRPGTAQNYKGRQAAVVRFQPFVESLD